jgi:hypothetical protein
MRPYELIRDYEALPDVVAKCLQRRGAGDRAFDALGRDVIVYADYTPPGHKPSRPEEERLQRLTDFRKRVGAEKALRASLRELEKFDLPPAGAEYIGYQATRCAAVACERIKIELTIWRSAVQSNRNHRQRNHAQHRARKEVRALSAPSQPDRRNSRTKFSP